MAEAGCYDGRTRKLPLWMLGVAAADQVRNSAKKGSIHLAKNPKDTNCLGSMSRIADKKEVNVDLRSCSSNHKPPKKAKKRRQSRSDSYEQPLSEDEIIEEKLPRAKRKKANPKSYESAKESLRRFEKEDITDEEKDSEIYNEYFDNDKVQRSEKLRKSAMPTDKGRNNAKGRQRTTGKKFRKASKTKTKGSEKCESQENQPSAGDGIVSDIELTMDDLMHMAEERVNGDRDKEHKKGAVEKPILKTNFLNTLVSENEDCDFPISGSMWRGSKCSSLAAVSDYNNLVQEAGKSLDCNVLPMENRTGDPKVDLLDVFLGPLIQKPRKEEKKLETFLNDFILSEDDNRQLMENTLVRNEAPLLKKKTSLKDKVAMFLG